MDATRWGGRKLFSILFIFGNACLLAGCGQKDPAVNSVTLNGQSCKNQVLEKSFLVKWKDSVPKEFEGKKLHPRSLVTRFNNTTRSNVEKLVLKRYRDAYELAEHEFYVSRIQPEAVAPCTSMNSTAWGPADAQAPQAWEYLGKKGEGVIVAVVDSGVDIHHAFLSGNIWVNTKEIPNNGIDDDRNGFIDDYMGYNFQTLSPDVSDDANHGTHVAGIIAGQAGPNGFTGIAPGAKIMPLKFIDANGMGSVGDAITAMEYAVAEGAKVINASWGGPQCSDLLKQSIANATLSGTVFTNAAGNDGHDINNSAFLEWPAAFQVPGKLTVASYNTRQMLSSFSNYGILVDLAAPGEGILSTVPPAIGQPDNQLCEKSGTSMAAPFVAGAAAILLSAKPQASAVDVANAINAGVATGQFGVRTQGKLNVLRAAQALTSY